MTLKHGFWELRKDLIEEMFIFPEEGTKILRKLDSLIEELQQHTRDLEPKDSLSQYERGRLEAFQDVLGASTK